MRRTTCRVIGALALALAPMTGVAQDLTEDDIRQLVLDTIRENPGIVIEALEIIQQERDAAEIAARQEALAQNRDVLVGDPNAPTIGADSADVVIVEFFDYNCPYCKRAAAEVKALMDVDPSVRVIYREWPILGEGSVFAARASLAAGAQGRYEDFHLALMALQGRIDEAAVLAVARQTGLDMDRLLADMQGPDVAQHLATSEALARSLGITGTPAFVIGDRLVPGAITLAEMQELVGAARESD